MTQETSISTYGFHVFAHQRVILPTDFMWFQEEKWASLKIIPWFQSSSGWWFGTFFIFPYIGNKHPTWLIFFRGVVQPPTSHGCSPLVGLLKAPFWYSQTTGEIPAMRCCCTYKWAYNPSWSNYRYAYIYIIYMYIYNIISHIIYIYIYIYLYSIHLCYFR